MDRHKLRYIGNWILPLNWQRLMVASWRYLQRYLITDCEVAAMVKKNTGYKNIHAGEDVFILCCGPSINNHDLLKLKGRRTIALSYFSLHEHYREIAPDYHLLAPVHPPLDFEHDKKIFSSFKDNGTPDTTFFLGHMNYSYSYFNFLKKHPDLKPVKTEYICYDGSVTLSDYNYNSPSVWDIAGRPFMMYGGLYGALQLAAYMGFKRIYILGADHDYDKSVKKATSHFYDSKKGTDDSEAHSESTLEVVFGNMHAMFHHYGLMRKHLESKGVEVINLGKESQLDVFKKQDFDSLF